MSRWKRAIIKKHTSFLVFHFEIWNSAFDSIDSALNFAPGYLTHFFQKCRRGTKKSSQTWKSFVTYSHKAGKYWNQFFCTGSWQESCGWNRICQILILLLRPVAALSFLRKIAQIVQKVIVFFQERREEIEPWFWHISITQWLKFSRTITSFFRFWSSSKEMGGQSWTKSVNFGSAAFPQNSNHSKNFQTRFLFARVLPLVRILAKLGHVLGE